MKASWLMRLRESQHIFDWPMDCDFDQIVSAVLSWKSLLFFDLHKLEFCWAGRLDGVERANKKNIKYLTLNTFFKCDDVYRPFR